MNHFVNPLHKYRCLVTGGLGYAGAWITEHLARNGHDVFVLSRKDSKPSLRYPYTLIQADIEQLAPENLADLIPENCQVVIHAASLNESFLPDYARQSLLVNALGTRNLLQALSLQKEKLKRTYPLFLYCSTFHVYGLSHGYITEQTPVAPRNDYALTHLFAEEYCRMFMRTAGIPFIILRLTNGYGAPKTPDSNKWYLLLNDICRNAITEGKIVLHSNPNMPRDFIWLGDVARTIERLIPRYDLAGNVYNVASGQAMPIGKIAQRVAELARQYLKRPVPLIMPDDKKLFEQDSDLSLHVSNLALSEVIETGFQDHMAKEILEIFSVATHFN